MPRAICDVDDPPTVQKAYVLRLDDEGLPPGIHIVATVTRVQTVQLVGIEDAGQAFVVVEHKPRESALDAIQEGPDGSRYPLHPHGRVKPPGPRHVLVRHKINPALGCDKDEVPCAEGEIQDRVAVGPLLFASSHRPRKARKPRDTLGEELARGLWAGDVAVRGNVDGMIVLPQVEAVVPS